VLSPSTGSDRSAFGSIPAFAFVVGEIKIVEVTAAAPAFRKNVLLFTGLNPSTLFPKIEMNAMAYAQDNFIVRICRIVYFKYFKSVL